MKRKPRIYYSDSQKARACYSFPNDKCTLPRSKTHLPESAAIRFDQHTFLFLFSYGDELSRAGLSALGWKTFLVVALSFFVVLAVTALLHLPASSDPTRVLNYGLNFAQFFVSIPLAIALGWRSSSSVATRTLSLILIASSLPWLIEILPSSDMRSRVYHLVPFILGFIYSGFLFLTLQFPTGVPLLRRRPPRLAFIGFAVAFFANAVVEATGVWGSIGQRLELLLSASAVAASFVALWSAWHLAEGTERQRISWVALSIGSIYITFATYVITRLAGFEIPFTPLANVLDAIQLVSLVALAVAMLRYRVFDIGFVINRTLVFSLTSLVLILVFFLAERTVHGLLHFESGHTSAWVDGTIAFILFFSFNKLHHQVDHWVERMFFQEWHANAKALENFIQKSAHFTESSELRAALGRELERFSEGARYAIYQAQPDGQLLLASSSFSDAPQVLSANADVAVTLRAKRTHCQIQEAWNAGGETAFPMIQGVKLNGLIILGRKPSGNTFRPDEVKALADSISQVGLILYALKVDLLEARNRELSLRLEEAQNMQVPILHELKSISGLISARTLSGSSEH